MKWLPGGWQRADRADAEQATVPHGTQTAQGTARYTSMHDALGRDQGEAGGTPSGTALLGSQARDLDVSAASFRNLLVGGGVSGLLTVLCAAALVNTSGSGVWTWLWQLISGVIFVWFVTASRGMLSSRGFIVDRSGFYARTQGEIFGVDWREIAAVGVGSLPWIQNRHPVHPERRLAIEFFPADGAFPDRHPELDRWLVEETPPMPGLPVIRYRFHLPPFSRVPRNLEHAVQAVEPNKWVGQYKREVPQQHA